MASYDIAVVIPVYNSMPYLQETRAALEAQTNQNFSVTCIDDASTDGSLEFLRQWEAEDPRCQVIANEHAGVSHARNTGLAWLAQLEDKPEFLLFHDADDMFAPHAFEQLPAMARQLNTDILLFTAQTMYQNEEIEGQYPQYHTLYERQSIYEDGASGLEFVTTAVARDKFTPHVCLQLFRVEFLLENNIRFAEGIIHEDNLFTLSCLFAAQRTAYRDEHFYIRRVRPGSIITSGYSWSNVEGYMHCITGLQKLLREDSREFTQEQRDAMTKLQSIWIDSAALAYEAIGEEERARAITLPTPEYTVFQNTTMNRIALRNAACDAAAEAEERGRQEARQEFEKSASWKLGRALTAPARTLKHKGD